MRIVGVLLTSSGEIVVSRSTGRLPSTNTMRSHNPDTVQHAFVNTSGIGDAALSNAVVELGGQRDGDKAYVIALCNPLKLDRHFRLVPLSEVLARVEQENLAGEASGQFLNMLRDAPTTLGLKLAAA